MASHAIGSELKLRKVRDNMAGKRTNVDALLIVGMATGRPLADVAAEAGVSERTVQRRMAKPEFQRKVSDLRWQMMKDLSGRLSQVSGKAMERLQSLLEADSENVRLGAARSILDQTLRVREAVDFEGRLQQIEALCDRKLGPRK